MHNRLLGIHMITRNEEDFLPQCLNSIRSIADELIIVDTGSTDRTIEIACSYGAKIVEMVWNDDFSQARNLALDHANTDWVLYLDADEVLADSANKLFDLLNESSAEAYWVQIENILGNQPDDVLIHPSVRLFRRREGLRFSGRIHEQITPSIIERHPLTKIKDSAIRLIHYGYLPTVLNQKNKIHRNLKLIERTLEEYPGDPFHTYNLGITFCQLERLEHAAETLNQALEYTPMQAAYRPTLVRDSAKVLLEIGQSDKTVHLLNTALNHYPDYPDLYHLLGQSKERQGLLQDAYHAYEKAAQCGSAPNKYVTEIGMGTFRTLFSQADLAKELGYMTKAEQLYKQSLAMLPQYKPALLGWADLMHLSGMKDDHIAEQLISRIKPSTAPDWMLLCEVLCAIGAYSIALALLKSQEPLTLDGDLLRSSCLMKTGQFQEVYDLLGKLLARATNRSESLDDLLNEALIQDRALCRWSENRTLPYSYYKGLTRAQQRRYESLDLWMTEGVNADPSSDDTCMPHLLKCLIERAVESGLIRIAVKLGQMMGHLSLFLAKSLYQHGYVLTAANCLLQGMKGNELDVEGQYVLAEILYDKGHFGQSAAMFEQLLTRSPENQRARAGCAVSYLQLACDVLLTNLQRFPDHPSFRTDLQRVESGIKLLNGTRWHTTWSGAQRRNFDAASENFAVYDRQK